MVAFNFKTQWASLVADGVKRLAVRWEVSVHSIGQREWFFVYAATSSADNGVWVAPSGRRYVPRNVRDGGTGLFRAVGLMRGIQADWTEVA